MRVKKIWECECGATKLVAPLSELNSRAIVKGDGFLTTEALSKATVLICRGCSDKYQLLGPVVNLTIAKRLWGCGCGSSSAIRNSKGAILLRGEAFGYGSPTTHIKCSDCKESHRVAPKVEWASHLALKNQKRSNSKANRRAKKRRQKSL